MATTERDLVLFPASDVPAPAPPAVGPGSGAPVVAALLAQLGAHAARRFSEQVGGLELGRDDAAILRLLAYAPGLSQREVADRLGLQPSRVVALTDALEASGLVRRSRSAQDRRLYELRLTDDGRARYGRLAEVLAAHEHDLTAPLAEDERTVLVALLTRLAAGAGLPLDATDTYRP